jgi:hypothetical protein
VINRRGPSGRDKVKQLTFGLAWAFVAALTIAAPAIAGGVDELP